MADAKITDSAHRYYPALDGVRAVAILLVMMLHLMVTRAANPVQNVLVFLSDIGWVGVDLFFVLSGFLITGILLDTYDEPTYFRRFYIRRVVRIFPLFYAVAIFSFWILPNLPFVPQQKLARFGTVGGDEYLYWSFLSNFAIAKVGIFRHGIMDVTWSLSLEEQFYLLWPVVVLFARRRLRLICIALFCVSTVLRLFAIRRGWNYNAIYVLPFLRLEGLSAGAFVATLFRDADARLIPGSRFAAAMLFGAAGFLSCAVADRTFEYYEAPTVTGVGFSCVAVMFGGLLGYLLSYPKSKTALILERPFLRFIGRISFALYLFHLPIRAAVRDLWITPAWINTTPIFGLTGQLLFYLVSGSLSIFAAALSYSFYEKHFLRLGRKLTAR
jgi:peptidoglycan/LPS O-acetylase OafA/YrhL